MPWDDCADYSVKDEQREIAFASDDPGSKASIAGQYSFLDCVPLELYPSLRIAPGPMVPSRHVPRLRLHAKPPATHHRNAARPRPFAPVMETAGPRTQVLEPDDIAVLCP
jgi:hypothetical protein